MENKEFLENDIIDDSYEDELTLTLELDDGSSVDCIVLAIFPMEVTREEETVEKQYIALVPEEQADEEEGDIFLYEYNEDEDGQPILSNIEDDDEFDAVCDRFDEICDEEDFDELVPTTEDYTVDFRQKPGRVALSAYFSCPAAHPKYPSCPGHGHI